MTQAMELRFLIEGQKNALEAIRLKELLLPKPLPKLNEILSEKDRLRVEDLMGKAK
jgi:hypothetical protein